MLTGTLGTSQSQPGSLQPGYFCTGVAVWTGPFRAPEVFAKKPGWQTPGRAGQLNVPLAVASQMAVADSTWWVFH